MALTALVDAAVGERVVVLGSPPPEGRDVDLLVSPQAERALAHALATAGFAQHGGEWIRFSGCSVEGLDLVPVGSLGLPDPEREALFAEARPLEGHRHLVLPAPHHVLLLLARRYRDSAAPPLAAKKRRRVERALEEDPGAWDRARERAESWGLVAALERLGRKCREPEPDARPEPSGPGSKARDLRWRLRTLRWSPLIAFSGLDGSGKTSQAEALKLNLERLGFEVELEWTRLEWTTLWEGGGTLDQISRPVKRALRLLTRAPVDAPRSAGYGERPADAASELRERSALMSHGWVFIVAMAHAAAQRRAVQRHLRRGKVVICDRYGASHRFRRQIRLLELLTPRPLRSYLVDAPAPLALERKPEQFGLEELERQAELYRQEAVSLGARRVDGARPKETLCEEIGYDAWSALRPINV